MTHNPLVICITDLETPHHSCPQFTYIWYTRGSQYMMYPRTHGIPNSPGYYQLIVILGLGSIQSSHSSLLITDIQAAACYLQSMHIQPTLDYAGCGCWRMCSYSYKSQVTYNLLMVHYSWFIRSNLTHPGPCSCRDLLLCSPMLQRWILHACHMHPTHDSLVVIHTQDATCYSWIMCNSHLTVHNLSTAYHLLSSFLIQLSSELPIDLKNHCHPCVLVMGYIWSALGPPFMVCA